MAETLRVLARISALPGKEDELRSLLLGLVEPTRSEPGCIRYELLQSQQVSTEFVFVEEWESEAAEGQHLQSAHIQAALVKGQSLMSVPPDIQHYGLLA